MDPRFYAGRDFPAGTTVGDYLEQLLLRHQQQQQQQQQQRAVPPVDDNAVVEEEEEEECKEQDAETIMQQQQQQQPNEEKSPRQEHPQTADNNNNNSSITEDLPVAAQAARKQAHQEQETFGSTDKQPVAETIHEDHSSDEAEEEFHQAASSNNNNINAEKEEHQKETTAEEKDPQVGEQPTAATDESLQALQARVQQMRAEAARLQAAAPLDTANDNSLSEALRAAGLAPSVIDAARSDAALRAALLGGGGLGPYLTGLTTATDSLAALQQQQQQPLAMAVPPGHEAYYEVRYALPDGSTAVTYTTAAGASLLADPLAANAAALPADPSLLQAAAGWYGTGTTATAATASWPAQMTANAAPPGSMVVVQHPNGVVELLQGGTAAAAQALHAPHVRVSAADATERLLAASRRGSGVRGVPDDVPLSKETEAPPPPPPPPPSRQAPSQHHRPAPPPPPAYHHPAPPSHRTAVKRTRSEEEQDDEDNNNDHGYVEHHHRAKKRPTEAEYYHPPPPRREPPPRGASPRYQQQRHSQHSQPPQQPPHEQNRSARLLTRILLGYENPARVRHDLTLTPQDVLYVSAVLAQERTRGEKRLRQESERALRAYMKSAVHALHRLQRANE